MKCPLCNRVYIRGDVAIKLYQSENECVICMTKGKTMLALPCGHQFCEEDLQKIGMAVQPSTPVRQIISVPRVAIAPARVASATAQNSAVAARRRLFMTNRRRRVAQRVPTLRVRTRKRCGWCGHMGHTIRRCRQHLQQCGCQSANRTTGHRRKLRRKHRCGRCGKRGHSIHSCHIVQAGI